MKRFFLLTLFIVLSLFGGKTLLAQNGPRASSPRTSSNDAAAARAKRIHFSSLVLDTHIDVTPKLQGAWKFEERHSTGHIDLPRMKEGGLNGLFFSIFMPGTTTGPKAVNDALQRIAAVHKLAADLPDKIMLCRTAADIRLAHRQGKIAGLMGMEGGHMINSSLPVLRMYAELGVRYLTLTHSVNTEWADSSGDQPKHNGLNDFGKEVVRELNKLGVMVDISHVSDKTFWDALEVSKAPMIASHSSCRSISGHPRNMTDEMIKALAAKGGVIQINYLDSFIDPELFAYSQKTQVLQRELRQKYQNEPREIAFPKIREEIAAQFGAPPKASWERIVEHIDYAVKLVGTDHVGLGSDFDGGSMPEGMEDCTKLPKITEALLKKGYKESDIKKILGLNTVRLLADVERASNQLRKTK